MLELWMVRHGETDWNAERRIQGNLDIPLNEEGIRQAHALGQALKPVTFTAIYTSDLSRAQRTASIVSDYLALPIKPYKLLRERAFGQVEGMLYAQAHERFPSGFPDIEPEDSLRGRAEDFIGHLREHHSDGHILCVSHGLFIRALLQMADEKELGRLLNTSVSRLTIEDSAMHIQFVNQMAGSIPQID